ncbi:MAG: hypothetical protein RL020_1880 [Pseudomonadota bacterium]|jgi:hypothetical protein
MNMNFANIMFCSKKNWFFIILPIIFLANYSTSKIPAEIDHRIIEASILFDLVILLPVLYAICYRELGRKVIVRTIGMVCLGIWLAGHLIPTEEQMVYAYISWLKYVGYAFLAIIEIRVMIFMVKLLYGRQQENENITKQLSAGMDIPEWAAKLMVLEAAFWKRLWKMIASLSKRH